MNKRELRLVKESAAEVGIDYQLALEILDFFKKDFKESISTGKTVRIPAIGIFYPSPKKIKEQYFKTLVTEETIVQERLNRSEYYKNKFKK